MKEASQTPSRDYNNAASPSYSQMAPVDSSVVTKQKERALKELQSRVKLAISQHQRMYDVQKEHIISEHDRQLQLAKAGIEYETEAAQMALESAYQQQCRSMATQAQANKVQIEQQANILEIQAVQQQMVRQHADREQQWNTGYLLQQ